MENSPAHPDRSEKPWGVLHPLPAEAKYAEISGNRSNALCQAAGYMI